MPSHKSYFDDQVQSVVFARLGRKQSVGVIAPGEYHFGTEAAERMSIVSGEARICRDSETNTVTYAAGTACEIAANSGFTISVDQPCAYWCEYI